MRPALPIAALSLMALTAACSGDPAPTATGSPAPDRTGTASTPGSAATGAGDDPDSPPVREIGFDCDSSELAEALSPVLRGSGHDTELDEPEPERLVCSWEKGDDQLVTLDVEAVDPVDSPRMTRAELLADGRQPIEDRRLDALGADGAGMVTQFSIGDSTVYLTAVIVTNDDFKVTVSLTEGEGGNDQRVGDAAIRTIELASGT